MEVPPGSYQSTSGSGFGKLGRRWWCSCGIGGSNKGREGNRVGGGGGGGSVGRGVDDGYSGYGYNRYGATSAVLLAEGGGTGICGLPGGAAGGVDLVDSNME